MPSARRVHTKFRKAMSEQYFLRTVSWMMLRGGVPKRGRAVVAAVAPRIIACRTTNHHRVEDSAWLRSKKSRFPGSPAANSRSSSPWPRLATTRMAETIFRAGQADIDLYIVESGQIEIRNPTDGDRLIVTHGPGQFSGDIDLLTGRPVIVTAVAQGATRLWQVPSSHLRALLNRVPSLGEKLIAAFTRRREMLSQLGTLGLRVVGPGRCRDTNTVREFLYKNFVPFTWFDTETDAGQRVLTALGSPRKTPVIECGNGRILVNPSLQELANEAGIWKTLPIAGGRFRDCRGRAGGHCRGRVCLVRRPFHFDARQAGTWRAGRRFIAHREFHRFSGWTERRGPGDARCFANAQVRRPDGRPGRGPKTDARASPSTNCTVLQLDCGAEIRCRVLLLALGVRWRRLEAAGADRFAGAGIYYACTTVEADLYDGADVAVVGGGNSAGQAVMFLAECCPSRQVHLLIRRTLGPGMSEYSVRSASGQPPTWLSMNRPRSKRFMGIVTWKRLP